jgi:murein DD-endopeptidase MepM/ murein hydrolase activator NlpD
MNFKKLATVSICLLSMFLTTKAQNNRLIAYNKSTVNAEEIMLKHINMTAFNELYDDWNNTLCHAKVENIPNTYKIDLRKFSMPIKQSFITSNFGYRPRFKRNHYGVDVKAYLGDTIYSAFGGKVRVVKNDPRGYGNVIVIRHWNGLETVYGHLSKQIVKVNDIVEAGQVIGLAGNTGRSFGTHLHFETRFCGIAINPLEIFSFKYQDVTDDFYVWRKK